MRAKILEPAIVVSWIALLVATIHSAPLRDVAGVALLVSLLLERRLGGGGGSSSTGRRFDLAVAAFLAVTLLTAVLGGNPSESFLELRFYPIGVLLFFGARRVVAGGGARVVALATLVLVDLLALDVLAQAALGASPITGGGPVWGRYTGSFPFPSDVSMLPILLPLGLPLLTGAGGLTAGIASLALVAGAVVASGTRAAALALTLVVLASSLRLGRRAWMALAAVLVAMAIAAAVAAGPALRLLGRGTGPEQRFAQWNAALGLALEKPLLGHGPHRFRPILLERTLVHDYEYADVDLRYAPYPHSVYLETLVGSGAVGLATLLALLAQPFLRAPRADRVTMRAARASVLVFAWVALFDLSLRKDWVELAFWVPLGVAAGAATPRDRVSRDVVGSESAGR